MSVESGTSPKKMHGEEKMPMLVLSLFKTKCLDIHINCSYFPYGSSFLQNKSKGFMFYVQGYTKDSYTSRSFGSIFIKHIFLKSENNVKNRTIMLGIQ